MFDYLLKSRLPPTLLQNTHKWLNFDLEQFFSWKYVYKEYATLDSRRYQENICNYSVIQYYTPKCVDFHSSVEIAWILSHNVTLF